MLKEKGVTMREEIIDKISESIKVKQSILNNEDILNAIEETAEMIINCYQNGGSVYIMGNGGSASDAQHMAGELVGRFLMERKGLPAMSFSTDTSVLTAIGNDYGYDALFERQTEAHVKMGDVVIGISTSGNSTNIIKAFDKAKEIGAFTVGLLGKDGGMLKNKSDVCILVECNKTPHVQESHITIIHILCGLVEKAMAK